MKQIRSSRFEKDPEARFWMNVKSSKDGCWEYCSHIKSRRSRRIKINGRKLEAHRYSYEIHYGSIPDDLVACHKCDNPACVRPDHIFLGTQTDNMRDCVAKKRHVHGSSTVTAKLSDSEVREIVSLRKQGWPQSDLAKRFGVAQGTISSICKGLGWKHLDCDWLTEDGRATLTPDEIREIRRLHSNGATNKDLAKQFGVTPSYMWCVTTGRSWKTVT